MDNTYAALPERFFVRANPAKVLSPVLLAFNAPLAEELGLQLPSDDPEALAKLFSGNALPQGADPLAQAYAGHQFGHFVPQLGDGRALLLGDIVDRNGQRRDIQLKGSGRTAFSRGGDGKSWLGPVLREYVVSEAMHHLGVPTTRALAAVKTGEQVMREQGPLPGGVFTRVAASHVRVGTFQYFASRGDAEAIAALAAYAIDRHYPELAAEDRPVLRLFEAVVSAQARLVSRWMGVGFIHGVMNTDNTSVSGETIDYGPCAFMDEFHRDKVFSSIDRHGRYAYAQQPAIAAWNLARLAEGLLLADDGHADFEAALAAFGPKFESEYLATMSAKFGIANAVAEDLQLIEDFMELLQKDGLDFTVSFRELIDSVWTAEEPRFGDWQARWQKRIGEQPGGADAARELMQASNPRFIPRNHRIEEAIDDAIRGDYRVFEELCELVKRPFEEQPDFERYAEPPLPQERVTRTFCGT
ncbi:MAG: YdiU family protein [Pseudomonadota bacterium]